MSPLDGVVIADFSRVLDAASEKLRANAARIAAEARDRGTTTHAAARELAQERVLAAMKLRVVIADFSRALTAVSEKPRANAARIAAEARDRGTTTHAAARELAQEHVLATMKLRGRVA